MARISQFKFIVAFALDKKREQRININDVNDTVRH